MIYSHGVVIRRVWVDVRVSERPSLVFSWELKVRNDTEPTDSSPSPGSAAATITTSVLIPLLCLLESEFCVGG